MTRDEVLAKIEECGHAATLDVIRAPSDDDIRVLGERVAEWARSLPEIDAAEYDHTTGCINVRVDTANGSKVGK